MSTMLHEKVKVVEGVDRDKAVAGFRLLEEAGLPEDALRTVKYELAVDECTACHRFWPRKAEVVAGLPTWEHHFRRANKYRKRDRPTGWPSKKIRQEIDNRLGGEGEEKPPEFTWSTARTCPSCTMEVSDRLAAFVVKLPKKLLNAFFRTFAITIAQARKEYGEDPRGRWRGTPAYTGYVALTNAFLQHLNHAGNARALKALVEASTTLGML